MAYRRRISRPGRALKEPSGYAATTLLALLGQRVSGLGGELLAAAAFLLPSSILMVVCAAAYSLVRAATGLSVFFDGMNAAMVGVVGAVTVELGRSALRNKRDLLLAVLCGILLAMRIGSEPVLAVAAATIGGFYGARGPRPATRSSIPNHEAPTNTHLYFVMPPLVLPGVLAGSLSALAGLTRVFLPIGVLTFGGGLAMIPAMEHMVGGEQRWLDPKAFADAIALGQITPGPVAICATFIGYRVAGLPGALVATFAMFAPATAVALVAGHSVERFREDGPRIANSWGVTPIFDNVSIIRDGKTMTVNEYTFLRGDLVAPISPKLRYRPFEF